ncbi:carboxylesterase/lipase family protein [Aurantiacibacter suaedae]|uniref:carboxylesterase/lipase family protein n=1 Tax=Aurantiacibacter suaedae TaxID=2545755 RepID=UPI0010F8DF96|nr:carboxylesterase family protein [Aurantiacibacter suaedae]
MIHSALERRQFLALGSVLAAGGCAGWGQSASAPGAADPGDQGVVETREGPVLGTLLNDCVRFLGVPFAAAPVGALRFRAPQPAPMRKDVLIADNFAPPPIQKPLSERIYGPGSEPSEDCLALNIWRPRTPGPHPVYVWIHGGGNVAGSSRMPVFDGAALARAGIVCVTISYRVGLLGFCDVSSLLGESYRGSGNNGMLDILAALGWVRDNIARFGGDPAMVTVGGQSAGAKNVCTLLAMPRARGLFRAAIAESGGAETINTAGDSDAMAAILTDVLGPHDSAAIASLPVDRLLAAQEEISARWPRKYPFRPVIDGMHLAQLPLEAIAAGSGAGVPLLIGTTRDENAFFGPSRFGPGVVVQDDLANMALADFAPVYARYDALMPQASATDRRYAAITAEEYFIPTCRCADAQSGHAPTYVYRLDMPREKAPNAGYSVHGSELPLVWQQTRDPRSAFLGPEGPAADRLADDMYARWVSFIREGLPENDNGPTWQRYETGNRATMLFDAQSSLAKDPAAAEKQLWADARFDF